MRVARHAEQRDAVIDKSILGRIMPIRFVETPGPLFAPHGSHSVMVIARDRSIEFVGIEGIKPRL